ncbi:MAG: hypothetical protein SGJ15_10425 [Bacteroidota bacterium]|nr:hypothetical protein [Bacteroidota bacterium]
MLRIAALTICTICIAFAACKKKRVCECTPTYTNAAGVETKSAVVSTEITDARRGEAKTLCQTSSTVETIGTSVTTERMECKLK